MLACHHQDGWNPILNPSFTRWHTLVERVDATYIQLNIPSETCAPKKLQPELRWTMENQASMKIYLLFKKWWILQVSCSHVSFFGGYEPCLLSNQWHPPRGFLKVIFDRWTHTAASPGEGEFFFGEKTWRLSPRVFWMARTMVNITVDWCCKNPNQLGFECIDPCTLYINGQRNY